MAKKFHVLAAVPLLLLISAFCLSAQVRVAVLPFQNMDGDMKLNLLCYQLQDSVARIFVENDPAEKVYRIVPQDSVEQLLAEFNVDPANPQYVSDMWKAVKTLNVQKVIMGSFNKEADRIIINAYIYEVKTKLPNPKFQAKDIFKPLPNALEAVPTIYKRLSPSFVSNKELN